MFLHCINMSINARLQEIPPWERENVLLDHLGYVYPIDKLTKFECLICIKASYG